MSDKQITAYAVYGAIGVQFAVSVVAGMMIGNYIDKKAGTLPWLTITGIVLGFIGGIVNLVRILKWFEKDRDKGQGSRDKDE